MDGFDGGIGNAPLVYLIIAIINTKCKLIHIQNLLLRSNLPTNLFYREYIPYIHNSTRLQIPQGSNTIHCSHALLPFAFFSSLEYTHQQSPISKYLEEIL